MSKVCISTEDVLEVATQLKSWSQDMSGIIADMKSKINNIKDWNDARASQFVDQAGMTARQLSIHVDNFNKMALFMQKYAQMQEDAEQAQKMRMQNLT